MPVEAVTPAADPPATTAGPGAVILADDAHAGLRVGGLSLLERTIFALDAAGVQPIIVHGPTGTLEGLQGSRALEKATPSLRVREAGAEDSDLVEEARAEIGGATLVLRADLVLTPACVKALLQAADERNAPTLGARGLSLSVLGPSGSAADAVAGWGEAREVDVDPAPGCNPVPNAAAARGAESALLRSLIKPTDGPVSKKLNRPFSLATSRVLARLDVWPNSVTTFVTLLSFVAAGFVATGTYLWIAVGAILFHVASVLDGCDGELSRLTYKGSTFGAWYDTLSDNVRYSIFFACCGAGAWMRTKETIYLIAIPVLLVLAFNVVWTMARYLIRSNSPGTHLVVLAKVKKRAGDAKGGLDTLIGTLSVIIKQDVSALLCMIVLLFDLPHVVFWLALVATVAMNFTVVRTLRAEA